MVYINEVGFKRSEKSAFGELMTAQSFVQGHYHSPFSPLNPWNSFTSYSGSATTTVSNNIITHTTTAAANSYGVFASRGSASYVPGLGMEYKTSARFPSANRPTQANQYCLIGMGNGPNDVGGSGYENGYALGYDFSANGSAFGVCKIYNSSRSWITQTNFNVDKLDGTGPSGINLTTDYWNVYRIKVGWLGFQTIDFEVLGSDGNFYRFHTFSSVNTNISTTTTLRPFFKCYAFVNNATSANEIKIETASSMIAICGPPVEIQGIEFSANNTKTTISTETSIIGIRTARFFKSVYNYIPIRLNSVSVSVDGTKNAIVRLYINASFAVAANYNTNADRTASAYSLVDFDTTATTYSANTGRMVYSFTLGKTDSFIAQLRDFSIMLMPNETLHVTVSSAANTDAYVALNWSEEL